MLLLPVPRMAMDWVTVKLVSIMAMAIHRMQSIPLVSWQ